MDAIALLEKDHRKVEALFQRFNDGGGLTGVVKRLTGNAASAREKRSAAEQICRELDVHADVEESTFYPAIRALRDERLDQLLDESLREHGSIKDRVQEARASLDDEAQLGSAMSSLQECVDHHVRDEENEMFPRITDLMPEAERDALGRELAARKRAPMPAGRSAKTPARARKRTVKRAASTSAARGRRVRKTTAKAKKPRTAAKSRAARRR
jgi:hemerythrin superfamily protein